MIADLSSISQIYIACGQTDLRKSIDGLAAIVQQNFKMNPFQNALFSFCRNPVYGILVLYYF